MDKFRVIIVGGGLAGSCLANGLQNYADVPLEVSVFERDNETANRTGYQIRLGAHALAGFRACLSTPQFNALMEKFGRSGGAIASAPVLFNKHFDMLIDLSKFPAYTKSAPISRSRLRDYLQAPLRESGIIKYGKSFTHFEILDTEKVRAHFDDGTFEDADIIVAADGNGSRVNRQLGCDNIVSLDHTRGYLGKCELPWEVLSTLPKQLIEKGNISCMSDNLLMFSAAYLPDVANAQSGGKTDLRAMEEDKQLQYDEDEASLMLGLSWERAAGESDGDDENIKQLLLKKVRDAGWNEGYIRMVEVLDPTQIYEVKGRVARPTPVDWRQQAKQKQENEKNLEIGYERVWLMGDAIHPMLPSRGMGANQAIHDTADALEPLLRLARKKSEKGSITIIDAQKELQVYEEAMIPRAFDWVAKSGGVNRKLPNFDGWMGKLTVLFMAQSLNIVGWATSFAMLFGWTPKDDAPELL